MTKRLINALDSEAEPTKVELEIGQVSGDELAEEIGDWEFDAIEHDLKTSSWPARRWKRNILYDSLFHGARKKAFSPQKNIYFLGDQMGAVQVVWFLMMNVDTNQT